MGVGRVGASSSSSDEYMVDKECQFDFFFWWPAVVIRSSCRPSVGSSMSTPIKFLFLCKTRMSRIRIHILHLHLHPLLAFLAPGGCHIALLLQLSLLLDRSFLPPFLLLPLLLRWIRFGIRSSGGRGTTHLGCTPIYNSDPGTSLISSVQQAF